LGSPGGLRAKGPDDLIPLPRRGFDCVGAQQRVVAQRGGNRRRAGLRLFEPRLHVVCAVPAGLEGINSHRLFLRQPRGGGGLGVGAFVLHLAARRLRNKIEFLRRCPQKVGHDRHVLPWWRLLGRRRGIDRFRRARIDRRLGQYIIAERDVLIVAAFGTSQPSLVRGGTPVRVGLGLVFLTREGVFLQFATIFGHGGRRRCRRRRALGSFGSHSVS